MTKHSNVTLSTDEILKLDDRLAENSSSQIAAAMLLLLKLDTELGTINDLTESNDLAAADRLHNFSVQVSFGKTTVDIALSCMDVYDAFVKFLTQVTDEYDLYR